VPAMTKYLPGRLGRHRLITTTQLHFTTTFTLQRRPWLIMAARGARNVATTSVPPISTYDFHFRDAQGRALLFRGINFTASAKAPIGQPSHSLDRFWEDAEEGNLNFIGRPVQLDDGSADVHLARLKAWGYNILRFVFVWEALEHKGPKQYDEGYMEYLTKVLVKCGEWGFKVFMDPHQDVVSITFRIICDAYPGSGLDLPVDRVRHYGQSTRAEWIHDISPHAKPASCTASIPRLKIRNLTPFLT
jgi:hypothetical protein